MKLVCAVTYVSLFFQIVQCVRLAYFIEKADNTNGAPSKTLNRIMQRSSLWRIKDCCHLPKEEQHCSCCQDACVKKQKRQGCCHLPQLLQNCYCCPRSCAPLPLLPPQPPQPDCCHLTNQFLSCECCPAACQPSYLLPILSPSLLQSLSPSLQQISLPELPPLTPLPPLPQLPPLPPTSYNCCDLPKPFRSCDCCVSDCQGTSTVPTPTTSNTDTSVDASNNCCPWFKELQDCSCCPQACKTTVTKPTETTEATTETTPAAKTKFNDCCQFPIYFQNCNCCPRLCQKNTTTTKKPILSTKKRKPVTRKPTKTTKKPRTTAKKPTASTKEPTTPLSDSCCNQPKEKQSCSCCSYACEEEAKEISPSTVIPTITPATTATPEFSCCDMPKEFRTCECCPGNCDAPAHLLPYENCCNWPKFLQHCDCCLDACQQVRSESQLAEANNAVEDCCKAPLGLQDCNCCPTSPHCILTVLQRRLVQPEVLWQRPNIMPYNSLYERYPKRTVLPYRYKQFEHRPETYFSNGKRGIKTYSVNRRTLYSTNNPCCGSRNNKKSDNNFSLSKGSYMGRQNNVDENTSDNSRFISVKNPNVYDYYFSNGGASRKNNKLADNILPSETPYQGYENIEISYRTLLDLLVSAAPKRVAYRSIDNNLADFNHIEVDESVPTEIPIDGLHMLHDVLDGVSKPDLKSTAPTLNSGTNSNINYGLFSRSLNPLGIPGILENLIFANKKYSNVKKLETKPNKNLQINPKLAEDMLPNNHLIDYLANKILKDDHTNDRSPRYHSLHLAAPVQNIKQLITRVSRRCNPTTAKRYNTEYPSDVQQLDKVELEVVYPTISNPRSLLYDTADLDEFGYLDDADGEEYSEVDGDDEYVAVIGNDNIELIPLEYSQRPFSSIAESKYYSFQPWNTSEFNTKLINMIPANGAYPDQVDLVSFTNEYPINNFERYYAGNDNLWKLYSAPPKGWYNSNILDGLAKIATGVEANHGEMEFESTEEDYSDESADRYPTQTFNDVLERITSDSLSISKKPDRDDLGIIPWLNMYGVGKSNYVGKNKANEPYYPKPSVNYQIEYSRSNSEGTDYYLPGANNNERLYSDTSERNYLYEDPFVALPILKFWSNNANEEQNPNQNVVEENKIDDLADPTTENEEYFMRRNSDSQIGLINNIENLSPITDFNEEGETLVKHKRGIKSQNWYHPFGIFLIRRFKPIRAHMRKDVNNPNVFSSYKRETLGDRDTIIEQMFDTLKGLLSMNQQNRMQMVSRILPQNQPRFIPISNPYLHDKSSDKKKKFTNTLLRNIWYPPSQVNKKWDVNPDDQSQFGLNSWPIVYGTSDAKTLEMPEQTTSSAANRETEVVTPPRNGSKSKGSILKEDKTNRHYKNKENVEEVAPFPLTLFLSQYIPLPPSPVPSFIDFPYLNNHRRMVYPEMNGLIALDNIDIPIYFDDDQHLIDQAYAKHGYLYRQAVVDNAQYNPKVEGKLLKPDGLYRMRLNLAEQEKGDKHADTNKIILQHTASSRVARTAVEDDANDDNLNVDGKSLKPDSLYRMNLNLPETEEVDNYDDNKKITLKYPATSRGTRTTVEDVRVHDNPAENGEGDKYADTKKVILQHTASSRVTRTTVEDGVGDDSLNVDKKSLKPDSLYRINLNPAEQEEVGKNDDGKILKYFASSDVARTSVKDDVRADSNGKGESLKPGRLYSMNVNPAEKEKVDGTKKISCKSPGLSPVARTSVEDEVRADSNGEGDSLKPGRLYSINVNPAEKEKVDATKKISFESPVTLKSVEDDVHDGLNGEGESLKPGGLHSMNLNPEEKEEVDKYDDTKKISLQSPVARKFVKDDKHDNLNIEGESLKPDGTYHINLNPAEKEEVIKYDDTRKIILDPSTSFRAARNCTKTDGSKKIVIGLEEPSSLKNSTNIDDVKYLHVRNATEVYINDGQESKTKDGNIET